MMVKATSDWDVRYSTCDIEIDLRLSAVLAGRLGEETISRVSARLKKGDSVLEIGCGTGQLSVGLALRRPDVPVFAVDRSSGAVEAAEALARKAGITMNSCVAAAESLPYADGSFNVVFADHVISFVTDIDAAFREMRRVLAPGGYIIVDAPNALRPDGWPLYQKVTKKPYQERNFFPWELAAVCRRHSFNVVDTFGSLLLLRRGWKLLLSRTLATAGQRSSPTTEDYGGTSRLAPLEPFVPSWLKIKYGVIAQKI